MVMKIDESIKDFRLEYSKECTFQGMCLLCVILLLTLFWLNFSLLIFKNSDWIAAQKQCIIDV